MNRIGHPFRPSPVPYGVGGLHPHRGRVKRFAEVGAEAALVDGSATFTIVRSSSSMKNAAQLAKLNGGKGRDRLNGGAGADKQRQ